jgi:hypothetical protein
MSVCKVGYQCLASMIFLVMMCIEKWPLLTSLCISCKIVRIWSRCTFPLSTWSCPCLYICLWMIVKGRALGVNFFFCSWENYIGKFSIGKIHNKNITGAKLGVFIKDCILLMAYVYLSTKYQNWILYVFFGIGYWYWDQTWPMSYNKNYNLMYNFAWNHDNFLKAFWIIKDIQDQNQ